MSITIRNCNYLILSIFTCLVSCATEVEYFKIEDFVKIEKIDAHVHINTENTAFVDQAKIDNFKLLTINVDYPDFPPIDVQQRIAISKVSAHPDLVAYASTFSMLGWDKRDWKDRTIRHLDSTFANGAIAVKVWKNIGMEFRDINGNLVMIDNPKFDDIFSHLRYKGITLIGHLGEPKSCWLPIEKMTVNYLKEYFKEHPQYHMYLHPEMPSYEDQINARDRMLEKNMNLDFVAAHLASLEWSVDEIAHFLNHFPNAVVDMAARLNHIQYQSSSNREKVRQFFIDYQDRILYGSDLMQTPDADPIEFKKEVHEKWMADWKYFNTDSMMTSSDFDKPFQGLALPKDVVEKIYCTNAKNKYSKAWHERNNKLDNHEKLDVWDWGRLRIVRSNSNIEFLKRLHATVNQRGGPIIFPKDKETGKFMRDISKFQEMLAESREMVQKFHNNGMFVIAYTTMALAGSSEKYEDIPNPEQLYINEVYETPGLWEIYQEYFGSKPPECPTKWVRHTYDMKHSFYRFRHPNAPRTGGRFEMFGCQDNPSYVQYFKGVIKLTALGGHDGAYIDWTKVHGNTCYCEHSKRAFRKYLREMVASGYLKKRYGITDFSQINLPTNNCMPLWREWLKFRSWSLTNFHKIIREEARKINPNFLLSGNINGGAYGNMAYTNGDDMEMMGAVDDFLYSEIQHGLKSVPRTEGKTKISNSAPLKFLAAAAMQKPVWMYCIQPSTPKPIPNEAALFNLIKLNIGEAFANHNTFSVVRERFGEPISPKVHNGAEQIYAFFKNNEHNLIGAKLSANVAIFCSINQFYSDEFSYFNPASRVLADNGIAHVMTVERDFSAAALSKYKVLILPYVPLISNEQVESINKFVNAGGGLVVLGLSSSKDENGLKRSNLGLSEVLGFDIQDTPVVVTQKNVGKGRVVFIPFNPLPVGKGDTGNTPLPDDHMMYGQAKFPAQIKTAFDAMPVAVEWAAAGKLSGKLIAPYTIEFTTMEQKNKNLQLIHLVNYNMTLDGVVTPAEDIKVQLLVPDGKTVSKITFGSPLSETEEISYNIKGQYIELKVPIFEVYGLVTVYLE